jgi:hypothetical protein
MQSGKDKVIKQIGYALTAARDEGTSGSILVMLSVTAGGRRACPQGGRVATKQKEEAERL